MGDDLRDIIAQLKLERSILRDGGYGRSVQTPAKAGQLFRDSITCLNAGETVRRHPCSDCLLWVLPWSTCATIATLRMSPLATSTAAQASGAGARS